MTDVTNLSADDVERLEGNYDALLFKLAGIEAANQPTIPSGVIDRLMAGEAPLAVWREHRGLSREGLAEAAGVSVTDIAMVEVDGRELGLRRMVALARALDIDTEDLLPWRDVA